MDDSIGRKSCPVAPQGLCRAFGRQSKWCYVHGTLMLACEGLPGSPHGQELSKHLKGLLTRHLKGCAGFNAPRIAPFEF